MVLMIFVFSVFAVSALAKPNEEKITGKAMRDVGEKAMASAREKFNEAKEKLTQAGEKSQEARDKIKQLKFRIEECEGNETAECEQARNEIKLESKKFLVLLKMNYIIKGKIPNWIVELWNQRINSTIHKLHKKKL